VSAERIAVCQHPDGGDYVPADDIVDGRCFMDCDCTPRVYVAVDVAGVELDATLELDVVRADVERYRAALVRIANAESGQWGWIAFEALHPERSSSS